MRAQDWPGTEVQDVEEYLNTSAPAQDGYPEDEQYPGGTATRANPTGGMEEGVTTAYGQTAPGYDDSKLVAESPYTAVDGSRTARADEDVVFNDQGLPTRGFRWSDDQKSALTQSIANGDQGQSEALWAKFAGIPVSDISPRVRQMITTAIDENRKHPGVGLSWLDGEVDQAEQHNKDLLNYGKYAEIDPRQLMDERNVLPEGADAFARGGALGLDDEIDAIVGSLVHGGDYGDELQRSRRVRDYQEEEHPYLTAAGGLTASMLLPTKFGGIRGLERVARPAAMASMREALAAGATPAVARNMATRAAQSAIRRQMVVEGTAYGAGMGAAQADGDPLERAIGAGEGALAGAAGGEVVGRLGTTGRNVRETLFPKARVPNETGQFVRAAERQGIEYLPADLPDAGGSRVLTSVANSSLGAPFVAQGADRTVGSLDRAVERVAGDIGTIAQDEAQAGQAVQRGLRTAQEGMERATARHYSNIPISPDATANLSNTVRTLTEITAGFKSNPALSKLWGDNPRLRQTLKALEGHKEAILSRWGEDGRYISPPSSPRVVGEKAIPGTLSWDDMKRMRSVLGAEIGGPSLTSTGPERIQLKALYEALSEDMKATAAAQGPGALRAFERANTYARASRARMENVFLPLLGKDLDVSPERAMGVLTGWAKGKGGDFAKMAQTLRSLPPEEASTVKATVLDTMGRAAPGVQKRDGDVFSPDTFMTNWNKLSERAQNALFGGAHAGDVRDIVRVAEGMKASAKYANTSKTALSQNVANTLGLTGGGAVWMATNPLGGALALAGQIGLGKLMGEPAFAKWLSRLGRKPNTAAIRAHVKRLAGVARAVPALADDLYDYQNKLEELFKVDTTPKGKSDAKGQ